MRNQSPAIVETCQHGTPNAIPLLRTMLEYGVDPDAERPDGTTPLMIVERTGSAEARKLLSRRGRW